MRWKISMGGSDEITRGHRLELEIQKNLDDQADGSLCLSVDDGRTNLASLQRHFIEQQCALYVLFRRHCEGYSGTRPIKDYSTRTIQTVYGAVTVERSRLSLCRRCMPGVDFTITPVSELSLDLATAELMTLTAKLGALKLLRENGLTAAITALVGGSLTIAATVTPASPGRPRPSSSPKPSPCNGA
jgi:hypothetical protein